jgi:hypothetical protein
MDVRIKHASRAAFGLRFSLATGVAALMLAGCANNPPADTPPTVQPTTVVTTPAPPAPPSGTAVGVNPQTNNTNSGPGGATGDELGSKVTEAIHINAQMTGSRVTAVSDSVGVIRLTGQAQNQQQKALAERTARNVSGVSSVVNKIEIVPTGGAKTASKPTVIQKTTKVYVIQKSDPTKSAPPAASTDTPPPPPPSDKTAPDTDDAAPAPASGQ